MGSGSLHAMTILESKFKDDLSQEEAVKLCTEAITAGIYHDLGSGSHVDYLVLTKDKADMHRNAIKNSELHDISL
jgi:20S proteasome subunit beta 2